MSVIPSYDGELFTFVPLGWLWQGFGDNFPPVIEDLACARHVDFFQKLWRECVLNGCVFESSARPLSLPKHQLSGLKGHRKAVKAM